MNIILFDGVCNLCNASVNFIIDRDKHNLFQFAALQSDSAQHLLAQHKIAVPAGGYDSLILIKDGKVYKKSTAALTIARKLSGLWPMFYIFIILPVPVRDFFYNYVSRNRYRLFGRRDSCRMPTPELANKFI